MARRAPKKIILSLHHMDLPLIRGRQTQPGTDRTKSASSVQFALFNFNHYPTRLGFEHACRALLRHASEGGALQVQY